MAMPGILGKLFRCSPARNGAPAIPADWRSLSWPKMRALAASHSVAPIRTKAEAERAILAALAKR